MNLRFPMWIVKVALDRPYTFIVLAAAHRSAEPRGHPPHADRYFPQH